MEVIGLKILDFFECSVIVEVFEIKFENAAMDVLYTDEGEIKLIEFNPVESSGGGLFSYEKDGRVFRGEEEKAFMRIVVD